MSSAYVLNINPESDIYFANIFPSLCWEDLLQEEVATYSSILGWEIPRTEEPGRLWPIAYKASYTTERLSMEARVACRILIPQSGLNTDPGRESAKS